MPRLKSLINLTPAQMLSKIKKSAKEAAYRGFSCSSKEELKRKRGYTDAQAELYLSVYAANKLSDEEQKLRKARRDAQIAASSGSAYPTIEALKAKGYSDAQIGAYRLAYEASKGSDEEHAIRKARHDAQVIAGNGRACLTPEILKAKGYSDAQIEAYRIAYEASKGSDEEQAIRRARNAAQTLASHGCAYPTVAALKAKGYSDTQIEAHHIAYEAAKGSDEEQSLRKARYDAQVLAGVGSACPTVAVLKVKGYNHAQIEAYRAAYDAAKGSDEEQAIRRARNAAQIVASNGRACSTPEILKAKGYSDAQIEAYRTAYEASKGTDEEQELRKARHDARTLASQGYPYPTTESLKVKGYSDAHIEAYRTAYEVAKGTDEEQAIRRARHDAQILVNKGYPCPTNEALQAKGYSDAQIEAYRISYGAAKESRENRAKSTLKYVDLNHDEEVDFVSDADSDEESAILVFSSIRSNITSTLATNTTSAKQDIPAKTRRLT